MDQVSKISTALKGRGDIVCMPCGVRVDVREASLLFEREGDVVGI